jgi:hypothetical protein
MHLLGMWSLALLLLLAQHLCTGPAVGLDNGYTKPPMGWNFWKSVGRPPAVFLCRDRIVVLACTQLFWHLLQRQTQAAGQVSFPPPAPAKRRFPIGFWAPQHTYTYLPLPAMAPTRR